MSRETRRAADLTEDTCVFLNYDRGEQVRVVMSAYTVNGNTTVVFNDGEALRVGSDVPFNLATQQEVEEADAQADRKAFAAAVERFADRVVQARLPVPHRDQRIHIGFDLDRDQDVQAWSRWLASHPQQGTSRLVVLAEVEGVEVMVRGPEGSTGEFGPDLADAALTQATAGDVRSLLVERLTAARDEIGETGDAKLFGVIKAHEKSLRDFDRHSESVEHRDSVGAFPIVGCGQEPWGDEIGCDRNPDGTHRCAVGQHPSPPVHVCKCGAAVYEDAPKPERDGWPVSDGHRPPVDEDAMQHDGRYDAPSTDDVVVISHGPVKPPYGSAERAAHDAQEHGNGGAER